MKHDPLYLDDYEFDHHRRFPEQRKKRTVPAGWHELTEPKPRTYQYSYSNEASQGALICETAGFPDAYNPATHECHSAYSDRMASWDNKRFVEACKLAGGGDQAWAYRLPALSPQKLREFAQFALKLESPPAHVRIVHHYNVSNGYSCPTVEAITEKKATATNAH